MKRLSSFHTVHHLVLAAVILFVSQALATITPHKASSTAYVSTVYQFPEGAWVENLAVRPNGQLLVTRLDVPELYLVDPIQRSATLVHSFADASGLLGITEISRDVYAVGGGRVFLGNATTVPGSFTVWKVDMRSRRVSVSKIAKVLESGLLNGMAFLDNGNHTLLVADSDKHVIWRVNMRTGAYSVALADETMLPAAGAPIPIGVNGVEVRGGFVYYTSSTKGLLCRVPVDATGSATGPFEILATWTFVDDFILDAGGTAYITAIDTNEIVRARPDGTTSVIAGGLNSTFVAGPTAVQFGRTRKDLDTLYITTSGAQVFPVNGTFTEGGKVVALRLARWKRGDTADSAWLAE